METEQAQITEEVEKFALDMFSYVFPKRFVKQKIPGRFSGTGDQPSQTNFSSDVGAAVLQICYIYRDSFYNRFLLDYPDYLADKLTLFRYCKRCALELYDEENIGSSLLMFSSMLTEMVSYCLMMSVEKGAIFVNSADECWSSIFVSQFASAFYASGGWVSLRDSSQEIAQMYEKTKLKYQTISSENGPFYYWTSDVNFKSLEAFPLEVGYFRIQDRLSQLNKSDRLLSPLFRWSINPNDAAIYEELSESFSEFSMEEDKSPGKSEKSPLSGLFSTSHFTPTKHDPPSMDVDDQSKAIKDISEETDLIDQFKSRTSFTDDLYGFHLEQLFESTENIKILINDRYYLGLMRYTVKNSETPDIKKLVEEARRVIREATSGALSIPLLRIQQTDICSGSSKDLEKHEHNLEKTDEKDNLLQAGKVKSGKGHGLEGAERKLITRSDVKMAVKTSRVTAETISQINNCIKSLRIEMGSKYISKVLQHLNNELGTTFPVDGAREFDYIIFPSTRQGTDIIMKLMTVCHELVDKIQERFEGLPAFLKGPLETNLKEIISGRTGIRISISTLERSRSTPSDIQKVSDYCKSLISVLICECAYFLRMKNKVSEIRMKSRDCTSVISKESRVRTTPKQSTSTAVSSEAHKRKRGQLPRKKPDALSSKQEMVDTPLPPGLADADASNSPVVTPKRPKGRTHSSDSE